MAKPTQASPSPTPKRPGVRVAAVVSEFHSELSEAMWRSARGVLVEAGAHADDFITVKVPGSFELGLVARRLAVREDVDCVLCFGVVIRGETDHNTYVAQGAMQSILRASFETDKPVMFGVLTCDAVEQVAQRALPKSEGGKHDKGAEVARGALLTLQALDQAKAPKLGARKAGFPGAGE